MFGNIIQNILRFALGINTEGHRGKMHFPAAALPVKVQPSQTRRSGWAALLQNIISSKYAQSNAEGI